MRPNRPNRRGTLLAVALAAALLAGCAPSIADHERAIQGRWRRVVPSPQLSGDFVGDPLGTLAADTFELRPGGVLLSLGIDEGSGWAWTTMTGEYAITAADQITVKGKCWQGWDSYDCSQAYGFDLKGDSLTITSSGPQAGQSSYTRVGAVSLTPPPTIVPPMPSATPTGSG